MDCWSNWISLIETVIQHLSSRPELHLFRKRSTLCSIAKLPVDVLIEIFKTACESTHNTDQPIIPLLFGRICKDWRQVAWSTPLLWGTVCVHVSKIPRSKVDLLREWLLRAQSTPLSIYLTLDQECRGGADPFRAIFKLLITRVAYWQTFDCLLPRAVKYYNILQDQKFPSLSSLSLRSAEYAPLRTMSLDAPRLVHVEFSRYDLTKCNPATFPLGQLRYFKMERSEIDVVQCWALLRCAPALKECYIDHFFPSGPKERPSQVLHTELELLCLSYPSILFLDSLTLPKLRVLNVGYSRHGAYGSIVYDTISSLISRSFCHLERLDFEVDLPFTDDVIIALLEALPSLTHFHLSSFFNHREPQLFHGLSDKLVSQLRPSESCLLPRLTSLKYRGPIPCDNRLLIDMLSERWSHVSRLVRAEIIAFDRISKDLGNIRADIDMLVAEGMQLEISDYLTERTHYI